MIVNVNSIEEIVTQINSGITVSDNVSGKKHLRKHQVYKKDNI